MKKLAERTFPLLPYVVIIGLLFTVAMWLHQEDLDQKKHNAEDCYMQANHAAAINKVIDNLISRLATDPALTPIEKKARIQLYNDSKAIVPDCSHE